MNVGFAPFPWLALILLLVLVVGVLKARHRLGRLPRLPRLSELSGLSEMAEMAEIAESSGPSGLSGAGLDDAAGSADAARAAVGEDSGSYRWLTAIGVRPDDALTAEATAYARHAGLLVLDLVPGDLAVEPLLDLLRDVNPATFRTDPVAGGRGAYQALLVHTSVLDRAGVTRTRGLSPVEMTELTVLLKRYAPRASGHVVAPTLTAVPPNPHDAKARFRALGAPPAAVLGGLLGEAGAFAGAMYATPFWGLIAFGVWWAQPYAVLAGGGTPMRPRHLHTHTMLRPFLAAVRWLRSATGPAAPGVPAADELAAKRGQYADDIADGLGHFFEDPRDTCPWCGSHALRPRLRTKDRLQGKPGRFTLDECRDCRHIFQNPRLSLAGLDYYYRDFYDGLGAEGAEAMFATMSRQYLGRARLVAKHAAPARWLDVGTGHAHHCLVAKSELPDTVFDGLDLGEGVEEAARRGWIERAYAGQFPDHADTLAGSYDLVSMHHYLEHVRDPYAELDAAAKVVRPGGHLLIELPDPQCWYARLLRRRWHPWFQPQHQHLMPLGNLTGALAARGFAMVAVEHGPAHQGGLFMAAVTHLLTAVAPDPTRPWVRGGPTVPRRARRVVAITALIPCYLAAGILDAVGGQVAGAFGRRGGSDAYRLLARKEPG